MLLLISRNIRVEELAIFFTTVSVLQQQLRTQLVTADHTCTILYSYNLYYQKYLKVTAPITIGYIAQKVHHLVQEEIMSSKLLFFPIYCTSNAYTVTYNRETVPYEKLNVSCKNIFKEKSQKLGPSSGYICIEKKLFKISISITYSKLVEIGETYPFLHNYRRFNEFWP